MSLHGYVDEEGVANHLGLDVLTRQRHGMQTRASYPSKMRTVHENTHMNSYYPIDNLTATSCQQWQTSTTVCRLSGEEVPRFSE